MKLTARQPMANHYFSYKMFLKAKLAPVAKVCIDGGGNQYYKIHFKMGMLNYTQTEYVGI